MGINASKKLRVFRRDNFTCRKCGSSKELTVDHINPISKGGTDDEVNLKTLCYKCNQHKGDFNPSFWQKVFGFIFTKREGNVLKNELLGAMVSKNIILYDKICKEGSEFIAKESKDLKSEIINETGQILNNIHVSITGLKNNYQFLEGRDDKLKNIIYLLADRVEALEKFQVVSYDHSTKSYK